VSDLRLNGREFDSPPPRGWVTVFRRINHLSTSPGHLSLLPSVGLEMSTSQSEVTFCGSGVKADKILLTPTTRVQRINAVKTRNPLKFAGVPQITGSISAASGPKFTIYCGDEWGRDCCLTIFPIVDMCLSCEDKTYSPTKLCDGAQMANF